VRLGRRRSRIVGASPLACLGSLTMKSRDRTPQYQFNKTKQHTLKKKMFVHGIPRARTWPKRGWRMTICSLCHVDSAENTVCLCVSRCVSVSVSVVP